MLRALHVQQMRDPAYATAAMELARTIADRIGVLTAQRQALLYHLLIGSSGVNRTSCQRFDFADPENSVRAFIETWKEAQAETAEEQTKSL